MPQRQPLKSSSQLRVSRSDSEPLRANRLLTDRSPKLLSDRRSPRGSQSDPSNQKKLGSRIADLQNQLGLAQEELKCLKSQLASTESAKRNSHQEKAEKKSKKPISAPKPKDVQESSEKENRLDEQETDVFEVPVQKVAALEPGVDDNVDFVEDEAKTIVANPSFEDQLALKNEEISSLKAKLEEKEKELDNFHQENESIKKQLNDKCLEASSAKSKEEEATLELNRVKEELGLTRDNAARANEKLEASEKALEALETEMKKLRVQTEQWRKAADAAATVLSGDMNMNMNSRRMSERCGSMEKYVNNVFEPVVDTSSGYGGFMGYHPGLLLDDSEDVSESGKKRGSGIKMLGDLWKKKSHK